MSLTRLLSRSAEVLTQVRTQLLVQVLELAFAKGPDKIHLGGQAVLEGVMMRGKRFWAVAVRKPDGQIVTQTNPVNSAAERWPVLKLPILRGILALIESITLALKALTYSAQEAVEDDVQVSGTAMGVAMFVAMLLGIGLFIALPSAMVVYLPLLLRSVLPAGSEQALSSGLHNTIVLNLVEGGIRIAIFIAYLVVISRMKDVNRVFQYHGAEHKVIHTVEEGRELTPAGAREFTTKHVRCGTSFLLIVMVTSILVFSFLGRPPLLERILTRLVVVPLVAGISYEIIKLAGKYEKNRVVRWLTAPGLLLQRLTTREPSDDQVVVAIASVQAVLAREAADVAGAGAEAKGTAAVEVETEIAPEAH